MIYGYARVSTLTQAKEGESLEAQKRQIQSYAISKGLELTEAHIFIEAGISGGIEFSQRPEGAKLTELVTEGDIIIFPKLDRAFRNTRNALNVLHEMKERKVSIHFIDLGGDVTGNGIGAIVFTILSAFATFEKPAFGYTIQEGVKVKKPEEQKIITEMKRLKTRGKSYRYIANWLNENKGVGMSFVGVKEVLNRA